ncbi:MAG: phage tail tape measure protein [Eubacterium sp.]|nr:phage tail tape measure protein [Eubacterium sp.]
MSQADGYVRIVTQNDVSEAQRSTEQLGDTIQEALDTTPADNMTNAMGSLEDGISDTGDAALKTGDIIKANLVSEAVTQGIQKLGSALKAAASNAVSMAMSNETAFAKASTLLSGDDLTKYFEGLIEMSNRTGVAFTDLAESMYSALSAGVPQDNVLEFVENTVNLSKGGFTQTATAIDIVTTALNAYQMEMSEATHVQDVLITTQNLGKTTVDELASNMGKLIPTANGVNVAFDQLGAMYATVTANGVATAETTTYLNAMINELGASGSTAEKAMQAATAGTDMAGKKISEISAMGYDVTDVLKLMDEYAQSTGKSLSDMFSSSEGAKAANILLSNAESFKSNITAMIDSTGAAATAAETMMDTTAEKTQVAKNQIDNLTSAIAEQLLPAIGETAQSVSDALDSSGIKTVAETVGSFISGTLTLLLKNINLIASAVTGVTAAVIAFKTANVLTKVIASWQTAALQVTLLGNAQGAAAIKSAALKGELTAQEIVYAVLSGKLDVATAKQIALNTAMNMNPAGIIAVAVGLLATALTGFAISAGTAESAAKELNDAIDQMHDSVESSIADNEAEMSVLKDKVKRYDELRTAVSLTSDEQKELSTLAQELQSVLGDEVTVVDQLTGKYNDLTDAVDTYVQKKTASVKLSAYEQEAAEAYNIKRNAENKLKELNEKYGGLNSDDYFAKIKATATVFSDYGNTLAAGQQFEADVKAAQKAIEEADKTISEWQSLASESYKDGITASGTKTPASTSSKQTEPANSLPDYWKQKSEDFKYWKESYKYDYDMGRISAEEYYTTLASLRDEFLENESDEWRSVNVEIKKYYDSLSEEQKKAYEKRLEEQKKADEESQKAAEQAAAEAIAAQKAAYSEEKFQLEFKLKTNQITEKKYYSELAKLRDKYLDKNSAEWRSAFLETYEYNQKIIQANKDALEQLLNDASDTTLSALEKIVSARDSLTAKLTDFNKTFEKVTETIPETVAIKGDFTITTAEHDVETYQMGADSIEDNIKVLEEYGAMLDALKARGADESTLSSILNMDIEEGMEFGSKLLNMSDQAWNSYFDSLERLHKTAAEISAKYYQDEVNSLKENFVDKLRSAFDGMTSDMYQVGFDTAKAFVEGWNKQLGTEDLTLGDIAAAVSGGTLSTAPVAAQSMSAAGTVLSGATKLMSQIVNVPVYIGTQKLADVMVDVTNGKIIQTGKNVLMT